MISILVNECIEERGKKKRGKAEWGPARWGGGGEGVWLKKHGKFSFRKELSVFESQMLESLMET